MKLLIENPSDQDRVREPIRIAVPCPRGRIAVGTSLAVRNRSGEVQAVQTQVLGRWPDQSAKWLLVDFFVTVPASEQACWHLFVADNILPFTSSLKILSESTTWKIDTGVGVFLLDTRIYRPFKQVLCDGEEVLAVGAWCQLFTGTAVYTEPVIEKIEVESPGPLHATIALAGRFYEQTGEELRFQSRIHFYAGSMAVQIEFTLHNPQAAIHPGGIWDLGDPGSILFKELLFKLPLHSVSEIVCIPESGATEVVEKNVSGLTLYQESSGGEQWRSPVHRNRHGEVAHHQKGYVLEVAGQVVKTGLRASPLVWCGNSGRGIKVAIPHFWQEFPKELAVQGDSLLVSLFPKRYPDFHELQGGEQKTHRFWIDFSGERKGIAWAFSPLHAVAAPGVYRESEVWADLPGENDLVDDLSSSMALLAKREIIDEYGWRNFGEIFADHEAAGYQGEIPFISHYNNQYDCIAGAYRKALVTADRGWRQLASELAEHVRDIDIYHTDRDREEYNNGLHWHTDHYLDAGLATHRSSSREHLSQKDPQFCGGGPGAEHCYTTGLALHYFQTGNPDFKQAVIELAEWEFLALRGPQTVLAALKRGVDSINRWRTRQGNGQPFPLYPLNRGTGNAVTACLDAFDVSDERQYLDRAGEIILNCLHSGDNIFCRDLHNSEISWSYTVLLAAVAKFLDKKAELAEFCDLFVHARASLLAYATWMTENEYPYLDKPEILEYPNETWVAQDLRKSAVLYKAASYAVDEKQQENFMNKAHFFFLYVQRELPKHPTSSFTRPVVLMLQNGWVGDRLREKAIQLLPFSSEIRGGSRLTSSLTLGNVLLRLAQDISQVIQQTSLKRELAWLRARI